MSPQDLQSNYKFKTLHWNELVTEITESEIQDAKADHGELLKYSLLRETALLYTVLRLKHLAKKKNFDSQTSKIRKKLNKLVLFDNQ